MVVDEISLADHLPADFVQFDEVVAILRWIMFIIPLLANFVCGNIFVFQSTGVGVVIQLIKVKDTVTPAVNPDNETVNAGFLAFSHITYQIMDVFERHIALSHKFADDFAFSGKRET